MGIARLLLMSKLPVGIIGCGNISKVYAEAGKRFEAFDVVACADLERSKAQILSDEFGIPQVLATEAEWRGGFLTGEIDGEPCHREHKLGRVLAWLPRPGGLRAFDKSWFYSDAASDLPLLQAVSHPVAVRPEPALREHALRAGWPVLDQGP